ncbi:MAG: hypothetical protein LBT85_00080 [Bifidobacteriaceae bacterium]|jgi:hypothetical protein|nr:hypothetical protein [Bifidobacteriaceae bacterium]
MDKKYIFYTMEIDHKDFSFLKNFKWGFCSEKNIFEKNTKNPAYTNIPQPKNLKILKYSNFNQLLKNSSADGIYIDTNDSISDIKKFDYAKRSINEHIPIVLSAPFFHSANKAKEIFLLAKRKKVFCSETKSSRFLPKFEEIISMAKNGYLKNILQISANISAQSNFDNNNSSSLYNLGVYPAALIYEILGNPNKITAAKETNFHNFNYNTNAIFKYYQNYKTGQNEILAFFYCLFKNSNNINSNSKNSNNLDNYISNNLNFNISILTNNDNWEFNETFFENCNIWQELNEFASLIKRKEFINPNWAPEDTINVLNILQKIKDNSI